jgi:hypothetical protein
MLLDAITKRGEPTPFVSAIEGAPQYLEQQLMIEWFCEELDRTVFQGLSPYLGIVIRRNKDDGDVASFFFQPCLQLHTRYPGHADVNDQARNLTMRVGLEERLC